MKLRHILYVALWLLSVMGSRAEFTATDAFVRMPRTLMPLLSHNQRLDMVDYFNGGFSDHREVNSLGGEAWITAISPTSLTVQTANADRVAITLLPSKSDTIIAVVETIATPIPDSSVKFFNARWRQIDLLTEPVIADWLTKAGTKRATDVAQTVPFMLAEAQFSSDGTMLTLTNNVEQWIGTEQYSPVADCLAQQLRYRWNGRKFQKVK